jgi:hypothetical protein
MGWQFLFLAGLGCVESYAVINNLAPIFIPVGTQIALILVLVALKCYNDVLP